MFNTPILFIVYNRKDTTQQVFDKIREIKPSKLYVLADGPKENNNLEIDKCKSVRNIFNHIDWECELITNFRDKNWGSGIGISNGIDWFFEHEEYGIILEDDCLPDISFFYFCQELLIKYNYYSEIYYISGNCRINKKIANKFQESYQFVRTAGIWGWATWKRAWKNYQNIIEINNSIYQKIQTYFPYKLEADMWIKNFLEAINDGSIWDYKWHFCVIINQGKVIYPNTNLVKNIGFGLDATHTFNSNNKFSNFESNKIKFPLIHPKSTCINEKWDKYRFIAIRDIIIPTQKDIFQKFIKNTINIFILIKIIKKYLHKK